MLFALPAYGAIRLSRLIRPLVLGSHEAILRLLPVSTNRDLTAAKSVQARAVVVDMEEGVVSSMLKVQSSRDLRSARSSVSRARHVRWANATLESMTH